ncbi:ammonium transporter [Brevundimonas sp.]|uniref:ammonium transporter n=1 Tax=Brevundimonas sp. TaxID=1871086 RepID=UPI002FC7658E
MNKDLTGSLLWAGGLIALGLGASFARQQGYIDGDTTTRIVLGAIGLMIAWFGNRMPKAMAPSTGARQVARVGGWSMALSGLVYAAMWAFAPFDVALIVGCGAVAAGMAVTIGYCLMLRSRAKAA